MGQVNSDASEEFHQACPGKATDQAKEIMITTHTHMLDCADIQHWKTCEIQNRCALESHSEPCYINKRYSFIF